MKFREMMGVSIATLMFASVVAAAPAGADAAGATEADAGIDDAAEVQEAVEEVLKSVPEIEELVEETAADIDDLAVDESSDVVVELETSEGHTVQLPASSSEGLVLSDGTEEFEIELPGVDVDADVASDGSVVYEDPAPDTDLVVQAQEDGGLRVIIVIDGHDAPTSFSFDSSAAEIMAGTDGSALFLDDDGEPIAMVDPAWAYDANGEPVPAWYTAQGGTLILHVDHSATNAYPVVADPSYHTTWYGLKTWKFNASETQWLLDFFINGAISFGTLAALCAGYTIGICAVPSGIIGAIGGFGRFAISLCKNSKGVDIHSWGIFYGTVIWCSGY